MLLYMYDGGARIRFWVPPNFPGNLFILQMMCSRFLKDLVRDLDLYRGQIRCLIIYIYRLSAAFRLILGRLRPSNQMPAVFAGIQTHKSAPRVNPCPVHLAVGVRSMRIFRRMQDGVASTPFRLRPNALASSVPGSLCLRALVTVLTFRGKRISSGS